MSRNQDKRKRTPGKQQRRAQEDELRTEKPGVDDLNNKKNTGPDKQHPSGLSNEIERSGSYENSNSEKVGVRYHSHGNDGNSKNYTDNTTTILEAEQGTSDSHERLLIQNNDIREIDRFILGEYSDFPASTLTFAYSIKGSNRSILNENLISEIKGYKLALNDKIYEKLENKSQMLFDNNNISKIFIDNCLDNFSTFSDNSLKIKNAILDKTNKIKINSFEFLLKTHISSGNNNTRLFNSITNSFYESNKELHNISNVNPRNNLGLYTGQLIENSLDYLSVHTLNKHNLIFLDTNDERQEFTKEIRSTNNDIIIQNIINLVRSLYTISPNCLIGNYRNTDERFYIDFNTTSLKCLKHEANGFELFKSINLNNSSININYFLSHSNYSSSYRSNRTESNEDYIDSILGKDTYNYMPDDLFEYVNNVMHTQLKNRHYLQMPGARRGGAERDPDINESFLVDLNNNLYNGKFFNVNISRYSNWNETLGKLKLSDNDTESNNIALFRANLNDKEIETIYLNDNSITNYNNSSDNKGDITKSDSLLLDASSQNMIENLKIKLHIDSFVKKHKLSNLKNKKVNIDFAKQIIEKIKNSSNEIFMLSYCKNDTRDISVIDESCDIYDMLFTSNESEVYSHIDLVSNHRIDNVNFLGLNKMKINSVAQNNNNVTIKNNFKSMFANYYPQNSLFSSSNLFYRLLKSLEHEASIVDNNLYEEVSLTQALYFNYFKDNKSSNLKVKNLIAERFLKKAIQLDSVSSQNFRDSNELTSFLYDTDSILLDDYDMTNKASITSYLDNILDSSENLKILKRTVFAANNISSLKDSSFYKRVSNIDIVDNFEVTKLVSAVNRVGGRMNKVVAKTRAIASIINYNVLPHYSFLFTFASNGNFNKDARVDFDILTKNYIHEEKVINSDDEDNADTDESFIYSIIIEDENFDIQSSKNIKNKLIPVVNKKALVESIATSVNEPYPFIIIEDLFDKACNTEGYVFNSLLKIIQDMIRMNSSQYENALFNNEEDIENFISANENLLDEVISIINIFYNIYFVYLFRLQRSQALQIFMWQKKDINKTQRYDTIDSNSKFPVNGIVSKHSQVSSTFSVIMGEDHPEVNVVSSENAVDLVSDISKLCQLFVDEPAIFLEDQIDISDESFSTNITEALYNIMQSLYQSDVAQATTFDLLNGYINHQTKLLNADRAEITTSNIFSSITNLDESIIENIDENFYDIFYINKLSKALFEEHLNNSINKNRLTSNINNTNTQFLSNISYFDDFKQENIELINSTGTQLFSSSEDVIKSEVFFNDKKEYYNSSFYSFALKKSALRNLSHDSIIKLKVSIVDKFNLSRFYMPKIYLFSPTIANTSYLTESKLRHLSLNMTPSNIIGIYNPDNDIYRRLELMHLDELINSDNNYIKDIVYNKFKSKYSNISDADAISLYKYLMYCHVSSNEAGRILKTVYDINSISDKSSYVSQENIDLVDNLDEKQFFDIFDSNKNDLSIFASPGYSNVENKTCYYDLLKNLDKISNTNAIENFVNNKYYDVYNIAISPESFYWIELSDNLNVTNTVQHVLNDFNQTIHKVVGTNLHEDANYRKKDPDFRETDYNLKVDNFDIVFDVEVLK